MIKTLPSSSFFSRGLVLGAALMVAACSSQYATRGNQPDPERLQEIVPGEIHAREVAALLGTPTTFSSFGGESWYYISERVEYFAFFEPKLLEREIVQVTFDTQGMVKDITMNDQAEGRDVKFVERKTPTAGNEMTFFEQIFGNIGRFNKQD